MVNNNKIKRLGTDGTTWVTVLDGDDYVQVTDYADDATALDTRLDGVDARLLGVETKVIPAAGALGQVLTKKSATDYDTEWKTNVSIPTGGATGDILIKSSATDYVMGWAPPRFGTATEHVEVAPTSDDKLRLVEDTVDGRPYMSIYNRNGAGALVRKGYFGNPEAASSASDIYIASDLGNLRLQPAAAKNVLINGNRVLTVADMGSGNDLDADTVDGLHVAAAASGAAGTAPLANQIIRSSASGYTYVGWLNTVSGATTTAVTRIFVSAGVDSVSGGDDTFLRYVTPDTFRTQVSADIRLCTTPTRAYNVEAATSIVTVTLGTTIGGLSLTGATGVFGSVAGVPSATSSGFITVFPAALASQPGTSNVNFPGTGAASGFFFVILNPSRQFKFYRNTGCQVIIDIQGFIYG